MNDSTVLSHEEESYHEWVYNNLYYIRDHQTCINVMKKLFTDGFSAGFAYRDQINAAEQLQK